MELPAFARCTSYVAFEVPPANDLSRRQMRPMSSPMLEPLKRVVERVRPLLPARLRGGAAVVVTFLDGMWIRRPSANHCAAVGEALAQLHLAGADFALKRKNALSVEGWRPPLRAAAGRAGRLQPGLEGAIATELDHVERHWPRDLPQGVIQADLFPD